jgi:hypothetical protein
MNSDFRDLLSALNAHRARFLVVGGYAVIHHAEPRYTKDLDLLVAATAPNAARVYRALVDFIGPLEAVGPRTLAEPDVLVKLGRPPSRIDLLSSIPGVRFDTAWRNRVRATYAGVPVCIISRTDLMRNKRAVGRPQDLVDLEALRVGRGRH